MLRVCDVYILVPACFLTFSRRAELEAPFMGLLSSISSEVQYKIYNPVPQHLVTDTYRQQVMALMSRLSGPHEDPNLSKHYFSFLNTIQRR